MKDDNICLDLYSRRRNILIDSNSDNRQLDLLLSFVWNYSEEGEVWKEVKETDGFYYVSNYGRVLSLKCNGYKLLRPFHIDGGYLAVDLRNRGER